MDPYAVDLEACRGRQRRLLAAVQPLKADLIVLTRRESVQWLTGAFVRYPFEPIAAMTPAGHVTLVLPDRQLDTPAAVDERFGYEAKWYSTTIDEQRAASGAVLGERISRPKQVACEFEAFAPHLFLGWNAPLAEIDSIVFELRRRKEPDELRMLARANEANGAMYAHAREIVRPGVNELDVYTELHHVAVKTLGEPLTYFGQDFRSNARGGAPRDRQVEAGDLMIIDLGVGFRGYHSDNCRTISVDRSPTDAQVRAQRAVAEVFPLFQSIAKPGVRCQEIFDKVQKQLDQYQPWIFNHHLGHGVGLAPQEGPHLNPRWDDTLAEGEFLAVEPGLYHEELRTGVRLEQNFVVKADGVELLTDWPLELV